MAQASLGRYLSARGDRSIDLHPRWFLLIVGFAVVFAPLRLRGQDSVRDPAQGNFSCSSSGLVAGDPIAITSTATNSEEERASEPPFDSILESLLERIRSTPSGSSPTEGNPKILGPAEVGSSGIPSKERIAELVELALHPSPQGRRRFYLEDSSSNGELRREKLRRWFDEAGLLMDLQQAIAMRTEETGGQRDMARWMLGIETPESEQKSVSDGIKLPKSNRGAASGGSKRLFGIVAKRASQAYSLLGWNPGTYAVAQSEHFEVLSQAGEKPTVEVALACESIRQVWQQVFDVEDDQSGLSVDSAFERVVLFRTREAYVRALRTLEPRIGISTGYYSPTHRTVFFYWEGAKSLPTLVHEVTHQLFDRNSGYRFDADASAGYWVIEALALYMESWSEESVGGLKIVDIGGWDSPRLQTARFRRLRDQYWIPWEEFSSADGKRLRSEPDIAKWYSQACGLAHCAMDQSAKERSEFLRYVKSVYGNDGKNANANFDAGNELLSKYDAYLQLSHQLDSPRPSLTRRNEIVLTRCGITSEELLRWSASARKLQWLDLGFTQVSDEVFLGAKERPWDVVRLNLELTNVSDASMQVIATMPSLSELDLTQCKVTDEGIQALAGHPSLRTLWIGGTQISDRSIKVLSSIPKLEQLHYEGSAMTQQGFLKLAQLKPQLRKKP